MGQHRPLLSFIFGLFKQTSLQFLQQICEKMSIQYMVPRFKLTISVTRLGDLLYFGEPFKAFGNN